MTLAGDGYELCAPEPHQFDELAAAIHRAYGGFPDPPEFHEMNQKIFEFDRAIVVRRDGRICATSTIYSLEMTVPGGPRPVAGVGYVSVMPDHRRRGLMRRMMTHTFTTLHETQAEPVAALHSTEAGIYGRFGYGMAGQVVRLTIPRGAAALLPERPRDPSLRLRATRPEEIADLVAPCYDVNVPIRPGMLRRDALWTHRALMDPPEARGGCAPLQAVVVEDDDGARGYALYTVRSNWVDSSPRNIVLVREIYARDPAAYAEIWATLLDLDLTATVLAETRPVDDPVLAMLADVRTAVPTLRDQLHVRLVDVDRALAARTYGCDVDLVLEVEDDLCPWNRGRWRLSGGVSAAECHRTHDQADLSVSIRALGAAYLGGVSLKQLAAAGAVTELRPGALAVAAAAFRHDPAPFCPTIF
ncbi:Predicted acetyltransferase [Sinosporangium album]|uniref:Predicted acetyltransferase n=1 Tax=Sinosporangium album TaxID=504805 RepID=A0A1G7YRC9_9ACTN|nr:GNAT family N-acetyltransferase [Sinosporangium album]SDG98937.1 Predicted acetyltransferase [Sinosporangium album]